MASSSASFIQKQFKYDVFLSFRGEDTRTNFVDHLYHALQQKSIHTYKDDERIKKGKNISDELIGSIKDSKFYIIVFSKNYASSSWCLDELVKIMECHKTTEHIAYPVFYDVEPSEVRKQSGAVGKAFSKHENEEAAGKWREALKEASDLAGWELKNTVDGHEAKFIQKIVEELSLELRGINFSIDEKLVGMKTRINDVLSSLETGYDDIRMIGIKGIGGGGKTTLARAVFDQIRFQYEGISFVENVREVSKASLSGLKSLQNQILSDVLNDPAIFVSSVYDGMNMMKRRMSCKKVLIVLDDVDDIEQLELLAGETSWFKPGSRIIITTRDEQVLVAHRVKLIHNVQLLLGVEAICLFCRYAFGRITPNVGYEELSQQVVHYAAGLPLTIKVLGSHLCGKNKLEWIDGLERLKTIPLMETLKKLEISYITLEEDYKEIFLNVACIMKGWSKALAIKALESCGFHARNGLRVLEQKSLITVDKDWKDEYLRMHDHIEEMGKNIVRRSDPDEPFKHSRLWIDKEIEDIVVNDLGNAATRYIQFTSNLSEEVVMKGLKKMKELRFLNVSVQDNIASKGDGSCQNWNLNNFPNALRFLCWNSYPFRCLPKTFQASNLVSLLMTHSRIVQLWEGGEKKALNKLRFLDLECSMLKTLDLGSAPNLELVDLAGCSDLVELLMPCKFPNLRSLKLSESKLRTLDIVPAPNLEMLVLENCYDLEELHMSGGYQKLASLFLSCSKLRSLDIGLTPNLEKLVLKDCYNLEELHMADECQKLASLDINCPKLRNLDPRLTPNLEELVLKDCYDLEELDMANECQKLVSLVISYSNLSYLDIGLTPNLKTLKLNYCYDLDELHMANECQKLTSLNINCSKLRNLDLGMTPNLEELVLENCYDLEELHMGDKCLKLTSISINCSKLKNLDLRLTPDLKELDLKYCCDLEELYMAYKCQKLTSVYIDCSELRNLDLRLTPNLKKLVLKNCYDLEELHMTDECLKSLLYLNVSGCLRFRSLKSHIRHVEHKVGPLAKLYMIVGSVDECPIHPGNNLPKFQFTCLYQEDQPYGNRTGYIYSEPDQPYEYPREFIYSEPDQPLLAGNLERLISVGLCACTNLETFSRSICGLQDLRELKLEGSILEAPKDLDQLESLEKLDLSYTRIKDLPESICLLKYLNSLELDGCLLLEKLPKDLGRLECLKKLTLSCAQIKDLPDSICMLKNLESLKLSYCSLLEKLPKDLGELECLESLNLIGCTLLRDIPNSICKLKCLKHLNLCRCVRVEELPEELGCLECLVSLDIEETSLSHLPQSIFLLKGLRIFGPRALLQSCDFRSEIQSSEYDDAYVDV